MKLYKNSLKTELWNAIHGLQEHIKLKMKQLINCRLLIIGVWTLLHFSTAAAQSQSDYLSPMWTRCGDSGKNEFTNGSAFQGNLTQVLDSLVENVSSTGFNTSSVNHGQNSNSTIYGLLQCRGDSNSSECKLCAETAKAKLLDLKCNSTNSAIIQLYACFLRYDIFNFYNVSSYVEQKTHICGRGLSPYRDELTDVAKSRLANISKQVWQTPKLFVPDSLKDVLFSPTTYLYSMAECNRDMSRDSCNACLAYGLSQIFDNCESGVTGAQFYSSNCRLRFETAGFFYVGGENLPPSSAPASAQTPGESLPPSSEAKKSNVLRITLGVAAAVVGTIAVIGLCKWIFVIRKRWEHISGNTSHEIGEINRREGEISLCPTISNLELIFKYDILREATSNFKEENKLGQGGFGSVFKGNLPDGRVVAVKRLKIGSSQGDAEFLNEANLISCIQHRNLVKLLGCSFENSERLLVYEYLPNSSLDKILFDPTKRHLLNWNARYEIILGTARGLTYLHEESQIRIIHRDIKASNILLDNKLRPKIADFGLARLFGEDETHVTTGIAGTIGYMAPEYALRGQLTEKADVFSFGVLVLEIISGRKNNNLATDMELLIEKTWRLYKTEKALEIMDPTLQDSYSWEKWIRVIKIGLLCTQAAASLRPSMSLAVSMLTSEREHLPSPKRPTFTDLDNDGTPYQVQRGTVRDIHSAAADPSSGILEPR